MLTVVWPKLTWILMALLKLSCCADIIFHVKEGRYPGEYVGDIATDRLLLESIPLREHNLLTFSQLHESLSGKSQLFNLTKTGKLYTALTLDAESFCKYNTECSAVVEVAVQKEDSFVRIIEVKVIVDDVNDNPPEFPDKTVNLQFYETDGKGTAKSIPNANDRDVGVLNSQITYQLADNMNETFKLSVSKKSVGKSKLEIILKKKLDKEIQDKYVLRVIARDSGYPTKENKLDVIVTVTDQNDNEPVFTKNVYNVSVREGYHTNEAIVMISAKDLDSGENGNVSYSFNSDTTNLTKSYFQLNRETGEIFLSKNFPFDKRQTYKMFIDATDNGSPPLSSTAIVLVNVLNQQNNAPRIDVKFVSKSDGNIVTISEGVKVGSFIAYVKVVDNDSGHNGEVDCILNHEKFMLQSLGKNKYKVVLKSLVNRELESHMDLSIVCEDKGFPSLKTERKFSIEVMDVNDVQPYFTKSTFKFLTYENEEPNFPVGFINATDPDLGLGGQLSYSLFDEHGYVLPFKISNFGFITTTQSLDHEQQETYSFHVLVKDNGTPSLNNTANVFVEIMDENDNAPYFTFPSVNPFNLDVHYHPQSKSDITTLRASDRDSHVNSFLRYEILGGNNKQLFKVNPHTGVLSFSRTVYQNDAGSYNLKLAIKDSGTPVLSATTTLSLTLTVSNTTARMYTAEDTESDNRIHINLMVIIVVAAVIVSVAIVVSIIVCVVHKRSQRNVQYGTTNDCTGERRPSGYVCEQISPKYDVPFTMVADHGSNKTSQTTLLRREHHSGYKSDHNWDGSTSGIHLPAIKQEAYQVATVTSGIGKEERQWVIAPDHLSEMPALPSITDNQHSWNEASTGLYETLPGNEGHCLYDGDTHLRRSCDAVNYFVQPIAF
ncbi:protocadherin beta-15-like isoform X2 [Octopus sinensis]|uniref:Protocadherin beta-15-like isoform X2 n=1 Tax=Octopus sinensis TaxID=2607531 RepID=A0A6P7T6Z0_9MOLL|nr:protocadherin beta-15-like isoform X2 [Octopus sinensis]XP_036365132.1 protocadherin beta-15-like isoform X2 [Octopus sinensis]